MLLPVSIWVQKNSIKMVKMQPEINFLNVKFFGDKDRIAEEQAKIFKREKYHPMASIIPLIIQLVLLMGVIEVIKRGISNPAIDMNFLGVNLSLEPSKTGISLLWSPLIAGFSAWILCVAQNASNVLQLPIFWILFLILSPSLEILSPALLLIHYLLFRQELKIQ